MERLRYLEKVKGQYFQSGAQVGQSLGGRRCREVENPMWSERRGERDGWWEGLEGREVPSSAESQCVPPPLEDGPSLVTLSTVIY